MNGQNMGYFLKGNIKDDFLGQRPIHHNTFANGIYLS